ncbi:mycofactocin biosynthesis peptidyl-dipeptidase MftE [Agromyces aerolatus]|uniref:mycofactocin biosynthesis peptidyl-dipeptidase MftE n=1 Tax=Agromyces sp. LY-1074 TaxID=3074080 RepID=UPI00285E89FD|nr:MULTISPECIES: mycofactocin biosynthesis peptidyl-dipeptidase MftE [unclassified Agromyces]MDR5700459.1 mycofactocin biosynthesis peptidyl-dipeptidase MftE [Agromyces sp. LY-1074]MDR5706980.1 mycofactocin biosynthesis peptidyl-dipeptidase MftE [Agromyces sp. LY-1358]
MNGEPTAPAELVDRSWPDVGRPVVLVPVGSTEQHGPHLPLDTDALIASAVADVIVKRLREEGVDAVVAPAVAYGASGEHQAFPGTASIGVQALTFLLLELGRSASEWAERVVFVNGHGGNVESLATSVPVLIDEDRAVAWLPCVPGADPLGLGVPVDAHAGRSETSILLVLDPDRVRLDRVEPGDRRPISELMPLLRERGVRAVAPNGVLGDPVAASADEGFRLFAAMVEDAWARLRHGLVDGRGCLVASGGSAAEPSWDGSPAEPPDPTTGAIS